MTVPQRAETAEKIDYQGRLFFSHNNPLTVTNTKSLKYICGNFTFEALNLHREKSTLEKIVPQGLIRNTELHVDLERQFLSL